MPSWLDRLKGTKAAAVAEAEANLAQLVAAVPERMKIVVAFLLQEQLDARPALAQNDPRPFLTALWDWGRLTWKTAPQPWRGVGSWRESRRDGEDILLSLLSDIGILPGRASWPDGQTRARERSPMPNIVASCCTVFGTPEAVARFRTECIRQQTSDAPAPSLDLEAVLPSPEVLRDGANSSAVSDGLAVLGVALPGGNPFEAETLEGMLDDPWVRQAGITTTEALKAALLARDPGCVAAAEAAITRVRETGYRDLGAWRRAKMGRGG